MPLKIWRGARGGRWGGGEQIVDQRESMRNRKANSKYENKLNAVGMVKKERRVKTNR